MLKYKGYTGHVIYDDEAKIFHGEVLGLKAVITFQGVSVEELESAFRESVDDYLDWCAERGKPAERPFSGRFNLRLPPELHAETTLAARANGMSLNQYVQQALVAYLRDKEQRFLGGNGKRERAR